MEHYNNLGWCDIEEEFPGSSLTQCIADVEYVKAHHCFAVLQDNITEGGGPLRVQARMLQAPALTRDSAASAAAVDGHLLLASPAGGSGIAISAADPAGGRSLTNCVLNCYEL